MSTKRFFLADALSFMRIIIFPVLVIVFAWNQEWSAAFAALVLGWSTDLLDGWAARRYRSMQQTHPQVDLDGIGDSALAFSASAVPVIYAYAKGYVAVGIDLTIVYAASIIMGIAMVLIMNKPTNPFRRMFIAVNMLLFHGVWQILFVTTWFAYMAANNWILTDLTWGAIVICAYRQLPKLERWWHGKL